MDVIKLTLSGNDFLNIIYRKEPALSFVSMPPVERDSTKKEILRHTFDLTQGLDLMCAKNLNA